MTLQTRLTEFNFNLETMELLHSLGQSSSDVLSQMTSLGFSSDLVSFCDSSKQLLNSVLLRLSIYSRQNFTEQQTRSSLSVLNNQGVNSLLDYLFTSTSQSTVQPVTVQPVTVQPVTVQPVTVQEEEVHESDDDGHESDDDTNPFDTFFTKCIVQTEEATDTLKSSDAYTAFQQWWESHQDDEVPDKKELKDYLNDKLGKCVKSKWTNVMLA